MKNISIYGATGYGGLELIRLLQGHPVFQIKHLIAPQHAGKKLSDLFPHLVGVCDLTFTDKNPSVCADESDLVFLALPHGVTKNVIPNIIGRTNIVDLSGDFRLDSAEQYQQWYKDQHECPQYLDKFIYSVPEIHKQEIMKKLRAVPEADEFELQGGVLRGNGVPLQLSNAGCFSTAIQLALWPLKDLIKQVSILAVTGSSGSGKKPSDGTHHPLRDKNMKSYKKGVHQHLGEICNTLAINPEKIQLITTSGPFVRGIFVTAFVNLNNVETLHATSLPKQYQTTYQNAPFIRLKDTVQLIDVVGSNYADISVDVINDQVVIQAVIDNMIKGAAGSAIQNANLLFGLDETTGLKCFSPLCF